MFWLPWWCGGGYVTLSHRRNIIPKENVVLKGLLWLQWVRRRINYTFFWFQSGLLSALPNWSAAKMRAGPNWNGPSWFWQICDTTSCKFRGRNKITNPVFFCVWWVYPLTLTVTLQHRLLLCHGSVYRRGKLRPNVTNPLTVRETCSSDCSEFLTWMDTSSCLSPLYKQYHLRSQIKYKLV